MRRPGKARRFIGNLCIILAVLFTVYMSVIMVGRINAVVLKDSYIKIFKYELVICAVFLVLALDIRTGFFTKLRPRLLKALGWILRLAVILVAGFVIFLFSQVAIGGMISIPGYADHAIVLGLALQNGQPTPDLLGRVDTAAEYARENPKATLILSGGNPNENGLTEAAVMRDLLIERGVAEDRMILEDKAETTIANFRNAAELVDPAQPVVLISSDYHMERAEQTAKDAGFTYVIRRPAPSSAYEYVANVMWEVIQKVNRLISK